MFKDRDTGNDKYCDKNGCTNIADNKMMKELFGFMFEAFVCSEHFQELKDL
jgi:hypothetical protein